VLKRTNLSRAEVEEKLIVVPLGKVKPKDLREKQEEL